jgi:hypothetical protein
VKRNEKGMAINKIHKHERMCAWKLKWCQPTKILKNIFTG